ncbi:MAG: ATP-binding protein [Nocardioides sp.]
MTRSPERRGISVRNRIVGALALLVTIALTLAGVIIYLLESARVRSAVVESADRELAEFSTLQDKEDFSDLDDLLNTFLLRNVAGEDEMLVGWIDGPRYISPHRHNALVDDPALRATITSELPDGGTAEMSSDVGTLLVAVQPVSEAAPATVDASGAMVVVSFVDDARDELNSLVRTYAAVSALSLGAITLLARWQAGRLLNPLRRLNDTARDLGSGDLGRRIPETGNDDITALTRTVNGMLARLERAFTTQRQFLDDAGHELRTPLTVLRGHLELLRSDDPGEVDETRALLLDEVDRMSRLVGDLTLLATSERPDFLSVAETDLDRLTRAVFAKAGALGDRRWLLGGLATGSAYLDAQRITQAMLQLADNAVKHTFEGSTISLGSSLDSEAIRFWVEDNGPGISATHHAVIFERFGRGSTRSDDGFGLGLSIVRAIVTAHGGRIELTDAEPTGARFTIVLPPPGRLRVS